MKKIIKAAILLAAVCLLASLTVAFADECSHVWAQSIAPTCTSDGVRGCALCGTVETIPATGNHVWSQSKPATCGEDGMRGCSVCGTVETIPATGSHTWSQTKAPTCEAAGMRGCSVCGAVESIPAVGHNWAQSIAPTCSAVGKRGCSSCGAVEEIACLPHTEAAIAGKEPTCTAEGLTAGAKCSVCGTVITAQTAIPATGNHTWKTVSEATCTAVGKRECAVCHGVESIPAKGHTAVSANNAVAATCTAAGKEADTVCSVCKAVITTGKTVPAKGHTVAKDAAVAVTCTDNGLTAGEHCSVCGTVLKKQEVVECKGHVYKSVTVSATTSGGGYDEFVCTVCGHGYRTNYTEALKEEAPILVLNAEDASMPFTQQMQDGNVLAVVASADDSGKCGLRKLVLSFELLEELKAEHVETIVFVVDGSELVIPMSIFEDELLAAVQADVASPIGYVLTFDPAAESGIVKMEIAAAAENVDVTKVVSGLVVRVNGVEKAV